MNLNWWAPNVSFPNNKYCHCCMFPKRAWIVERADGSTLMPPIAVCPVCDWPSDGGANGPVSSLDRVRDIDDE